MIRWLLSDVRMETGDHVWRRMHSERGLRYWAVKEMTSVPAEEYRPRKADKQIIQQL